VLSARQLENDMTASGRGLNEIIKNVAEMILIEKLKTDAHF
jgi:hypothetical protein